MPKIAEWVEDLDTTLRTEPSTPELISNIKMNIYKSAAMESTPNTITPVTQGLPKGILDQGLRNVHYWASHAAHAIPDRHESLLEVLNIAWESIAKETGLTD